MSSEIKSALADDTPYSIEYGTVKSMLPKTFSENIILCMSDVILRFISVLCVMNLRPVLEMALWSVACCWS